MKLIEIAFKSEIEDLSDALALDEVKVLDRFPEKYKPISPIEQLKKARVQEELKEEKERRGAMKEELIKVKTEIVKLENSLKTKQEERNQNKW